MENSKKKKDTDKYLILDLDETLIYCTDVFCEKQKYDFFFKLDNNLTYYIVYRPHLITFLNFAKLNFNLIIWTSSAYDYAQKILSELLTNDDYILITRNDFNNKKRFIKGDEENDFYQSKRYQTIYKTQRFWNKEITPDNDGFLQIKPLEKIIKKYNLDKTKIICIDNDPYKYIDCYGNFWGIKDFVGEQKDVELLKYIGLLKEVKEFKDVKHDKIPILKKHLLL